MYILTDATYGRLIASFGWMGLLENQKGMILQPMSCAVI
jgi:hypothetical protein